MHIKMVILKSDQRMGARNKEWMLTIYANDNKYLWETRVYKEDGLYQNDFNCIGFKTQKQLIEYVKANFVGANNVERLQSLYGVRVVKERIKKVTCEDCKAIDCGWVGCLLEHEEGCPSHV